MLKKTWLAAAILAVATTGWAEKPTPQPAQPPAKIHGHVQDPLGVPRANAQVVVVNNANVPLYTFVTDENGDYKGDGIAAGSYDVLLLKTEASKAPASAPDTSDTAKKKPASTKPLEIVDTQHNVHLVSGADTQVDFDLTRKAYIDTLPPDVRKSLEDARAKNASILAANAQIKNTNAMISQARAARQAGNFDQAIALDQQAVQSKPNEGLVWYELGTSQAGAKKYNDAITTYKKALDLLQAEKSPKPEVIASTDNELGSAYAKTGKTDLALAAYDAAAKAQPSNAAMYYGNEAVILFKAGQGDAAGIAADKAIAVDPNKPTPYYIKGWSLVQKASIDPKTQKIVLPAGCAAAYQKFLDLAPEGPLADDARSILASAGETIHSSYKKGRR